MRGAYYCALTCTVLNVVEWLDHVCVQQHLLVCPRSKKGPTGSLHRLNPSSSNLAAATCLGWTFHAAMPSRPLPGDRMHHAGKGACWGAACTVEEAAVERCQQGTSGIFGLH